MQPTLSMQTLDISLPFESCVKIPAVSAWHVGLPALLLASTPAAADDWLSSLQLHALSAALSQASASTKPAAIQKDHPFSTMRPLACFV